MSDRPTPDAIKGANPWACWADCVMASDVGPSPEDYELPEDLHSVPECLATETLVSGEQRYACYCGESVEWLAKALIHAAGGDSDKELCGAEVQAEDPWGPWVSHCSRPADSCDGGHRG